MEIKQLREGNEKLNIKDLIIALMAKFDNKHSQFKEYYYFCNRFQNGPIVKWIEWRIPVPLIRVRVTVGSPKRLLVVRLTGVYFFYPNFHPPF